MKQITLAAVAFVASASFAQAATVNGFTSFIALGDSLSDDGKLPALPLPSLDGRFTNGLTFAEQLAMDFEDEGLATDNLAVGGATAGDVNTNPITLTPFAPIATFSGQVAALGGALLGGAGAVLGNNPLVSVLFGANDLFQNLGTPDIGQQAALDVEAGIRAVGALDPRLDDFLLINLPNIGMAPAFMGGPFEALASAETIAFNDQLTLSAEALRDDGFNVIEFDLDAFFVTAQAELGLELGPCRASFSIPGPSCADSGLFDVDTLFFADSVHPTAVVHAAAANAIRNALPEIPLPAGMPLLLTGIALYGLASRRNRSRV